MGAAHKQKKSKQGKRIQQQHFNERIELPPTGVCTIIPVVKQENHMWDHETFEIKTEITDEPEPNGIVEIGGNEKNKPSAPIEHFMHSLGERRLQLKIKKLKLPKSNSYSYFVDYHSNTIDNFALIPAENQTDYICDQSMVKIKTEISEESEQFGMDEVAGNNMNEPSEPNAHSMQSLEESELQSEVEKFELPESNSRSSFLECNNEIFDAIPTDGCYIKSEFECTDAQLQGNETICLKTNQKKASMSRNTNRKGKRMQWTVEKLALAMEAVHNGMQRTTAAKLYGVPKCSLSRYLKTTENPKEVKLAPRGRFSLSLQQEEQLVMYAKEIAECFHGLSALEMRSLAFQMAEKSRVLNSFNRQLKLAGWDWLQSFLQRHRTVSLRKQDSKRIKRGKTLNRESVVQFFNRLELIYSEHAYPPSRIWNVDDTGVRTVKKLKKRMAAKDVRRHASKLISSEVGVTTTVMMAMSASGQFLPPFFIFPCEQMDDELKLGAPSGSAFTCNISGWITLDTFSLWFDHFLLHANPTADNPVLLVLDGCMDYTKNLEVWEKAKANHVRMISIPPDSSQKTQPLLVSFMWPFAKYYSKTFSELMERSKSITVYDVAAMVSEAFTAAGTLAIAQNGFRKTGIHPFDRQVFKNSDFAPSAVLKRSSKDNNVSYSSDNDDAMSCAATSDTSE
ncbi:uncharacterized protein LOC129775934 isoform X2 [Toxorhynchites rutilus septentrionalis]|nr:uncharacterized protein LOC129775934 isoform X2 [Toxorhynchites rutilus septentrionalis]